jgi:uncharacterized protein (TIGR02217 family)
MTNFHDVNLPKYIEIFATANTEFSTSCSVTKSGREVRSLDSALPRRSYSLKDCRLSKAQFEVFNSFFYARRGRRFSFRLKDYCDYKVKDQQIVIIDAKSHQFQLTKIYPDLIAPFTRKIIKPVSKTIKISGVKDIKSKISWSLLNEGVVKISTSLVKDTKLLLSYEFDVLVRFDKDSFQYSFNEDGTISLDDVKLIEVFSS